MIMVLKSDFTKVNEVGVCNKIVIYEKKMRFRGNKKDVKKRDELHPAEIHEVIYFVSLRRLSRKLAVGGPRRYGE